MSNDALTPEPGAATQIPAELDTVLDTDPTARARFDALAPSHRREYIRYVAEAARPDTRQRRAEKTIAMMREKAEAKTA